VEPAEGGVRSRREVGEPLDSAGLAGLGFGDEHRRLRVVDPTRHRLVVELLGQEGLDSLWTERVRGP